MMTYKQRDIVEVNFLFADGQIKVHPARKFGVVRQPYFDEIVDKIIESIF